ncbi:MAG TPA: prepilin-type N-terminal cleavage/methylation domain-containing protein [Gemmataceae bacterium]|jgi:prepilin-type N-terminal cleavage/methylation domain-containing protein|nr:prepilin-type N-terminal cleavage/methylation domain-containing protein [Gemmataceae bacterium]
MRCKCSVVSCPLSGAGCRPPLTTRGQRGTPHDGRCGFTLIEMLVVMALLTMLTGILVLLLKETLQVERSQAKGFDKVLQSNALADQFRADVSQSESASQEWRNFKADRHTLILQMPGGSHVVYVQQEDAMRRSTFENDNESVRMLPLGSDVDVEFGGDAGNPNLICMRMHVLRKGNPLPGQALEIAAALGGDWR